MPKRATVKNVTVAKRLLSPKSQNSQENIKARKGNKKNLKQHKRSYKSLNNYKKPNKQKKVHSNT